MLSRGTSMTLKRYLVPLNVSTILCILSLFCVTQMQNILLLFVHLNCFIQEIKVFFKSVTRSNMHFIYVFSMVRKVQIQVFGPLLNPTSYPIITRACQA